MGKTIITVRTSELRKGDIVLEHGMRLLIDREIEISRNHPDRPGVGDGKTRWTLALVLNRDDVPTDLVPWGWTADWRRDGKYLPKPHDGQHRWAVQGNDNACWFVEREVDYDAPFSQGTGAGSWK